MQRLSSKIVSTLAATALVGGLLAACAPSATTIGASAPPIHSELDRGVGGYTGVVTPITAPVLVRYGASGSFAFSVSTQTTAQGNTIQRDIRAKISD